MPDERIAVSNNSEEQRYEVNVANDVAVLTYRRKGNEITFLHTGVPPALEGRGIANELARVALEDARKQHLTVVPACPFVAAYMRRHPAYLSLVTESERVRLQRGE